MAETISGVVERCLTLFHALVGPEDGSKLDSGNLDFPDRNVAIQMIDQHYRFKLWVSSVGADKPDMSSLDYRLRDASHIKIPVINLVKGLIEMIEAASAIVRGERTPWDQEELEEDLELEEGELDQFDVADTQLGQIAISMVNMVGYLVELKPAIRNPAPHDRIMAAKPSDASRLEHLDVRRVASTHRSVKPWLADRLGKSISRTRQYLKHRLFQHEKLSHKPGEIELDAGRGLEDQTVASSTPSHPKEGRAGSQGFPILKDDGSDAGMSQTSCAACLGKADILAIPPLPKEAHDGPFQCPLCYMVVVAKDRASWDPSRPFHVCLEEDCITPENEYSNRHEWIQHVRQNHWAVYTCPSCEWVSTSREEYRAHLATCQPAEQSPKDLDALSKLSRQPVENIQPRAPCPLCHLALRSDQHYQRHVGRHQEQLSLFALHSPDADIRLGDGEGDSDTYDARDYIADDERHCFNALDDEKKQPSIADLNNPETNHDGVTSDTQSMLLGKFLSHCSALLGFAAEAKNEYGAAKAVPMEKDRLSREEVLAQAESGAREIFAAYRMIFPVMSKGLMWEIVKHVRDRIEEKAEKTNPQKISRRAEPMIQRLFGHEGEDSAEPEATRIEKEDLERETSKKTEPVPKEERAPTMDELAATVARCEIVQAALEEDRLELGESDKVFDTLHLFYDLRKREAKEAIRMYGRGKGVEHWTRSQREAQARANGFSGRFVKEFDLAGLKEEETEPAIQEENRKRETREKMEPDADENDNRPALTCISRSTSTWTV
ncbi:uncharacterized protein B0H64DRAFT_369198 [Chaetomium fimeti]|uniref:C2H2-type domain-containing protein n=1 Tax=Chaetomium fimeti TaxID=1854472 RepID=A0AAE0HNV0_9PEZI|nr:hypothetical protein B0H64DRAFT_369198 [Chaetomium fimeti]